MPDSPPVALVLLLASLGLAQGAGSYVEIRGSEGHVAFVPERGGVAKVKASCAEDEARFSAIHPSLCNYPCPNVSAVLLNVPPSCANLPTATPCAASEWRPSLFYCTFEGVAGVPPVVTGPYKAEAVAHQTSWGATVGLEVLLRCELPTVSELEALRGYADHESPVNTTLRVYFNDPAGPDAKLLPFEGVPGGDRLTIVDMPGPPPPGAPPLPPLPSTPPEPPSAPPSSPPGAPCPAGLEVVPDSMNHNFVVQNGDPKRIFCHPTYVQSAGSDPCGGWDVKDRCSGSCGPCTAGNANDAGWPDTQCACGESYSTSTTSNGHCYTGGYISVKYNQKFKARRTSVVFGNGNRVRYKLLGRDCDVGVSSCGSYTELGEFTYMGHDPPRRDVATNGEADQSWAETVSFPNDAEFSEYKWEFLWSSMDTWGSDITASETKGHWWVGC